LHAAAQAQHQVQRGLFLDVVVGQRAAVFQLLACKDQALLVGRDALLVLDLGLDILDRVGRLHLQSDGLAGQSFDEDLHRGYLQYTAKSLIKAAGSLTGEPITNKWPASEWIHPD
jgi:hypothetical protein